jgi:hypothetical protein
MKKSYHWGRPDSGWEFSLFEVDAVGLAGVEDPQPKSKGDARDYPGITSTNRGDRYDAHQGQHRRRPADVAALEAGSGAADGVVSRV